MDLYKQVEGQRWGNLFGNEPTRGNLPKSVKNLLESMKAAPKRGRTNKRGSPKRASSRSSTRSKMRAAAKSPSPPRPKEGTLKKSANGYNVYKKGNWEKYTGTVYNEEGKHGGPFSEAQFRALSTNKNYVTKHGVNWINADRKARRAAKVAAKAAAKGGTRRGSRRSSRRRS